MERVSTENLLNYPDFWVLSPFLFLLFLLFTVYSVVLGCHSYRPEVVPGKENLQLSLGPVLRRKW